MLTPRPPAAPIRSKPLPFAARLEQLSTPDLELVLANARLLQQAVDPLQRQGMLRGKNLALLSESADGADAVRFRQAASDLGAHVSHIRPSLSDLSLPDVRCHTARMLGRLYQGIECQGLPAELVSEMRREAGIPVYDGVASATHPCARLAGLLEGGESDEKKRQLVLQAVLVSTIG